MALPKIAPAFRRRSPKASATRTKHTGHKASTQHGTNAQETRRHPSTPTNQHEQPEKQECAHLLVRPLGFREALRREQQELFGLEWGEVLLGGVLLIVVLQPKRTFWQTTRANER